VFASYLIRLQTKPESIDNFYLGHCFPLMRFNAAFAAMPHPAFNR